MANIRAAIKQIRKDVRKRERNQVRVSELKNLWTKLSRTPGENLKQAQSLAQDLVSKWDRAVSHGIVPKSRANRKKARIALFLNRLAVSKN